MKTESECRRALAPRVVLLVLGACACAAEPVPMRAVETPPARPVASAALDDANWAPVESRRFGLELSLPDRSGWVVDDQRGPWLVARHAASRSLLLVRRWRAQRLVTPAECEAQARLWLSSLPEPEPEEVVERRELLLLGDTRAKVVVSARGTRSTDEVAGSVLAFGAAIGRCFAFAYTTLSTGQNAERALAARLSLISRSVLPELEALSVEDRARPPAE